MIKKASQKSTAPGTFRDPPDFPPPLCPVLFLPEVFRTATLPSYVETGDFARTEKLEKKKNPHYYMIYEAVPKLQF
jgi:hypothetical protein